MFNLGFRTDNAAFEDHQLYPEAARILREIAIILENRQGSGGGIWDRNDNIIGSWILETTK